MLRPSFFCCLKQLFFTSENLINGWMGDMHFESLIPSYASNSIIKSYALRFCTSLEFNSDTLLIGQAAQMDKAWDAVIIP